MTKCLVFFCLIFFSAICISAQNENISMLNKQTENLLIATEYPTFSYALPTWQKSAEQILSSSSEPWETDLLNHVVADDVELWYTVWSSQRRNIFLWVMRTTGNEGTQEVHAFADDISLSKKSHSPKLVVCNDYEGLCGFSVVDSITDDVFLSVADLKSRAALKVISDVNSTAERKEVAETILKDRLGRSADALLSDLSGMPSLAVCEDERNNTRIITYMVANKDFTSHCGGWVVSVGRKNKKIVSPLTDVTSRISRPEQATLSSKAWYGAIYTQMIPFKKNKKQYYLLTGFKGADLSVKTRVIDVMTVNNGVVTFGAKVFRHPKATYSRRIFQYSTHASMNFFLDKKSGMLVFDHLEPSDPLMAGQPAFYGPDLSYDAYMYDEGVWKFQSDIEITEQMGAKPNKEIVSAQSEQIKSNAPKRQNGYQSGSASGKSSSSSRSSSGSSSSKSSWFDKGKGNNAPNIRNRR